MRQSHFMKSMFGSTLAMMIMANSAFMPSATAKPSPFNKKGELKKAFNHNPRNNRKTKAKRK